MLTLLPSFFPELYVVGDESYFHIFPCTISFYSRPNAHASNLQSHFVRCTPPHAMRVDPCLKKGECEIFRCSVVPRIGTASARFSVVLNPCVRIFCILCLPFAKLIYCSDLCQDPGLRPGKWVCFMNDRQFIPRPR